MGNVVVKPWSWRIALFGLAVMAVQWELLYLWIADGVQGAGNVVMAWNGFLAVVGILAISASASRLTQVSRPGPPAERYVSRASNVAFCLLMAWMGFWWLLVARLIAMFGFFVLREAQLKALASQEGANV